MAKKDCDSFVGKRLRINTAEGDYEGTVHSIDPVKRKLTLTKVELLDENDDKEKYQETQDNNHNDMKVNSDPPGEGEETVYSNQSRPNKPSEGNVEGARRGIRKAFQDAGIGIDSKLGMKKTDVSSGSLSRDASDEGNRLLKKTPIEAEKYLSDMLSDEEEKENLSPGEVPTTVVVDSFGKTFEDAVKFVSKQRVIGVVCEGINLGRYGKLCWLVVIYLFDILTLGAACFDEGLQNILESGDILKVIHDCRQVSDALFHQYRVRLVNVFDTQVADVVIYKNEKAGELPRACPLPESATEHVMYLRELRLAQMERIMAEFIYGVDIYLSVIKGQVLPSEFRSLNQFGYRLRSRRFDGDFHEDAVNGVPEDVLSNREAWNEGQEFAQEYKNKKGRVQERKYGLPKTTLPSLGGHTGDPLLQRPDGTLPTQVDRLRQAVRGNASGSDSEGSSVSSEGTSLSALVARELQEKAPTVKSAPL
ncbi:piRNA biogenesis protein EXD1 [Acropora cervicornis]|uniref:PiRNA biogenesis protein EXD1 n=1 Tax=Acropora cervicornis TaxID=6130 RepID=A0AAD9UVF3_ACRCE|nr:piRNA biogenesis protein EXD1 [Acropora cervicornis]